MPKAPKVNWGTKKNSSVPKARLQNIGAEGARGEQKTFSEKKPWLEKIGAAGEQKNILEC